MTTFQVALSEALATMPAKAFLRQQGISNTLWKRIKHSGTFKVNGEIVNAARTMLKDGDTVSYQVEKPTDIEPEALPLDIRYEDEYLLIVNKPPGQLVHPTTKEAHGTLAGAVLYHYKGNGEAHSYHPIHRLDRDTSGLVLIAKEPQVQYLLAARDGTKLFHREYLAIVEGRPEPPEGLIDAPIARALPSIILRKVSPEGKEARTHYKTLSCFAREGHELSLVELRLETGRTHQIRVHMSHLGHPLAGDDLYGGSLDLMQRQALHAYRLHFPHPVTKESIDIKAELPTDMQQLLT
ncbi:MAG: RluA family pseudouridine synthase [Selenomonas sp.]|nr:RluA family pseudouridine synthase [Selenomonas sp.]